MSETPKNSRKSRKVEVDWTEERVQQLIQSVEAEPALWNATLAEYRNKVKRDSAWNSISEIDFNSEISGHDLNVKWQGLRSQYKEQLNKMKKKKSGDGTDDNYVVRWKYFVNLRFLDAGELNETVNTLSNYSSTSNVSIFFYF